MRSVQEMVENYTMLRLHGQELVYNEVMLQYIDMAKGGDGGELGFERDGETTCRGINYKGYPDSFFQEVCEGMGWLDNKEATTLEPYSADPI